MRSTLLWVLACFPCWGKAVPQETATIIQQVNQAPAPPVAWNAPDAIPFGTALSAVQLNATAAAVGTFAYQPASGAILPPGTSTLSVVFFPSDQNYQTASASVPIIVVSPGSSSFTVVPLRASSPAEPLMLQPGVPATVPVAVGPIGDFHQPVTLSCKGAPSGRRCLFSPGVIRPTTDPVQVSLTFAPTNPAVNAAVGLLPGITSSALFGLLLFRRRFRTRTGRTASAGVVLALPLLALFSGCGCDFYTHNGTMGRVEIDGSSLKETRIAYVYVTDDSAQFPLRLRRPLRKEENNKRGAPGI